MLGVSMAFPQHHRGGLEMEPRRSLHHCSTGSGWNILLSRLNRRIARYTTQTMRASQDSSPTCSTASL